MNRYKVKTLVFPDGERLPILINRTSGIPEFYPNLFAITQLRQINCASNTIERGLRDLAVLLDYFGDLQIDAVKRVWDGELFTFGEIDGLARYCQKALKKMNKKQAKKVHFLDPKGAKAVPLVNKHTTAIRLRTIHRFLKWLIDLRRTQYDIDPKLRKKLDRDHTTVLEHLASRIPKGTRRNVLRTKEALSPEQLEFLKDVISPDSPCNPWKSDIVRHRNSLIIHMLLRTGLRCGELLGLKIDDIVFEDNFFEVARRPDDPDDPRRKEPNAKTLDRPKALSGELTDSLYDYIINIRSKIHGANTHTFLIVSSKDGAPLSRHALYDIFTTVREHVEKLPSDFSSHICRHTFSTMFARALKESGHDEESSHQALCEENGWVTGSDMPAHYTKPFIREQAREASLSVQEKFTQEDCGE
ncbi:site-specific integrase [Halodesulfovibrio sp.]|uniref:tyrosine-type recombinase/integrase n=1 Tax=Halodesulfovibrio sp. TaxID=1912772 RepID=UPI0025BFE3A3|nr:site-specific integrase [Halodesulfovibrio sp.]